VEGTDRYMAEFPRLPLARSITGQAYNLLAVILRKSDMDGSCKVHLWLARQHAHGDQISASNASTRPQLDLSTRFQLGSDHSIDIQAPGW
jgi:hypothetical protein